MIKRHILIWLLLALIAGVAWAQDPPPADENAEAAQGAVETVAPGADGLADGIGAGQRMPNPGDSQDFDHTRFVRHMSGTETCLACHGSYNPIVRRPDSPRHSLWINSDLFLQSVHAKNGCHSCHTNIDAFGHRLAGSGAIRTEGCAPCHAETGEAAADADELAERLAEAVAAGEAEEMQLNMEGEMVLSAALRACIDCHEEEYAAYKESVHGQSVLNHKDSDAPFCMDCHGIHYVLGVDDPRSKTYPANVPSTCLNCHDQADIKARAGLERNVGQSFEESFHGKRGELGGIAVAVCSTCHGNHAIYAPDDPRSLVNQRNLARTCGECHEGAQLNFATAFTHKTVSPTEQKGLYILKQIYKWVIFLLIAQFVLFAGLDIFQLWRRRRQAKEAKHG